MKIDRSSSTFQPAQRPDASPAERATSLESLFRIDTGATGKPLHIALIGNFTPRQCGIATFTNDVFQKLGEFHREIAVDVYALDDAAAPLDYGPIAGIIERSDPEAYRRAARQINDSGVDAVWLQHEYGIFGGDNGEMVCDFADRLAAPLILTPHTVLSAPSQPQRSILEHLVARASQVIVMSSQSRDLLAEAYGAPHEILQIIPHGAPDRPFGRQEEFKRRLGLADRRILMTFGLLGPGKGVEHVIEALPAIVERHPDVVYRIVGATHPNLVANEGEAYRDRLVSLASELGVAGHVLWENRFLETGELLDQLEACDIYLTPYPNLQQSTSGTLSYAVALGKAVVSTPYVHACELLSAGAGKLIEPDSPSAIADAVCKLLGDPASLAALQKRAYAKGRETIWPRFAAAAAEVIENAAAPAGRPAPAGVAPGLSAVLAMSDSTGILQHSIGIVPDRRHGYCLDDNARALMLMTLASGLTRDEREKWSLIYGSFVQHAWNEDLGQFRNFMGFDRNWREEAGSEDSNGRAFWALGHCVERAPDPALRAWARQWYDTALPHCSQLASPRAKAFAMLGAAAVLRARPDHHASQQLLHEGAEILGHLLDGARRPDWAWFEAVLGYDNPRLSQALIEAGSLLHIDRHVQAGRETLEWIAAKQISANGHFRPIGSDTFGHRHSHLPFDQQPLEAQAAIEASRSAYLATGETRWLDHAQAAWRWFFGANDRGVVLADLSTGRCRDGITTRGANANCGAESVLAFQLAHYSMLALPMTGMGDSAGGSEFGKRGHDVEVTVASS